MDRISKPSIALSSTVTTTTITCANVIGDLSIISRGSVVAMTFSLPFGLIKNGARIIPKSAVGSGQKETGGEIDHQFRPPFLTGGKGTQTRTTSQPELGRNRGTRKTYSGEERQLVDPFPNSDGPGKPCSGIR